VGELGEPNTNKRYRVDGVAANFRVKYAVDGKMASHVLSLTGYATSASADEESWVLLGRTDEAPPLLTSVFHPDSSGGQAPPSAKVRGKQPILRNQSPAAPYRSPRRLLEASTMRPLKQ